MAQIDPRAFGDPLALRTQWSPLFRAGAVPLGRPGWRLHEASASRVELRRALSPLPVAVFAGPALLTLWPLAMSLAEPGTGDLAFTEGLFFALLWLALGIWLLRPAVFDRDQGAFWIGWLAPARPGDRGSCALNQIQALQLLRLETEVRQQHRPAQKLACFQLNLVLVDATRRCLAMSLDLAQLRGDASKLQRFLSCRTWDATGAAATVAGATNTARAMAAPARVPVRTPAVPGAVGRGEPRQGSPGGAMVLLAGAAIGIWLLADSGRLAQLADAYRRLAGDTPLPEPPPAAQPVPGKPVFVAPTRPPEPAPAAPPVPAAVRAPAAEATGEPTELAQCANVAPELRAQCAFGFFVAQACRGETDPAANGACRARERAKYGVPQP